MTQETKQEPPALPGETWRGAVLIGGNGPRPCAVTLVSTDVRAWVRMKRTGEWSEVTTNLRSRAILAAWALHERAVCAAERTLRVAQDALRADNGMFGATRALRQRAEEAYVALRALGVEP